MQSKKTVKTVKASKEKVPVKNTEIEELQTTVNNLTIQNQALAVALQKTAEESDLNSEMLLSTIKALVIRLSGSVLLDFVTIKAATNPKLKVLQEYSPEGHCKYTLTMKGDDEE